MLATPQITTAPVMSPPCAPCKAENKETTLTTININEDYVSKKLEYNEKDHDNHTIMFSILDK